jgi:DNA-nicking Smr family endonuclease
MSRRKLSPGEHDLWRRTVRDVAPLRRPSVDKTGLPARPAGIAPLPHRPSAAPAQRRAQNVSPDAFSAGDPRLDRHASRGRLPIDATFDLHGHNQASARAALYGFLLEARRRGHRCVLVITGKGAREIAGRKTGGVLQAKLRDWLMEDAFRQHIVRASAAHSRHGGSGAVYLFLKASGRKPSR